MLTYGPIIVFIDRERKHWDMEERIVLDNRDTGRFQLRLGSGVVNIS